MPREQKLPLKEVTAVAASATVTVRLESLIGRRIKSILLTHGYAAGTNTVAAAATNITEIRFIVNERIRRRVSGTQLRDLLLLNGASYDFTGVPNTSPGVTIPIPFAEPWRQDRDQRDLTAFPTAWGGGKFPFQRVSSLRIEVTLGAASTPTLAAWAVVDDVVPDVDVPAMVEWTPISIPAGGTVFDYAVVAKGELVALSLYVDSLNSQPATNLRLNIGGNDRHDLSNTANNAILIVNGNTPTASGRTASIYDLVADHDDNLNNVIDLNTPAGKVLTVTAASAMGGTITAIAQLGNPVL